MFLLAYRSLQSRPARTLFSALAIALGVAMIFATRIVGETVEQEAQSARSHHLLGADLEVRSATGVLLTDALAAQLAARPDIELATPTYQQPGSNGLTLLGVDPDRHLGYELASGEFFSGPDAAEVLLPALWAAQRGIRVGREVTLEGGGLSQRYRVVGLLQPGVEALVSQPTAWLPLSTMQQAFDAPGAATAILLRLQPGTHAESARQSLQEVLGAPYLVTSTSGGAGARSFLSTMTDLALPFAGIAVLLTAAFLVYNAFAITLAERRQELGQLRTLGMTQRQVLSLTLLEALLVALLASGLGLLLGTGLARGMIYLLLGVLQEKTPPTPSLPLDGMILASAVGVLVTMGVTL
ncbi:MAG: ABC transporter permease [Ardenticatenales bacterium]|nr:ABC transporter permease [Ardenticatenales bacterium]